MFMLEPEIENALAGGATAVVYEAVNCADGSSTWGTERVALKVSTLDGKWTRLGGKRISSSRCDRL